MLRHWVQASWNHCKQLRHCSIFKFHLRENTGLNLQTFPPLTASNPAYHLLPCSLALPNPVLSPSFLGIYSTTTSHHSFLNPRLSLLTPQDHHSNSSSAAGCSDVQSPSPAPLVHMAETASCPAWPGHRGPSSVHPLSAKIEQAVHLRGVGRTKALKRLWVGGFHRKGLYLGGDGKDALAADPGCALSFSRGWGPWNVTVLVISWIMISLTVEYLLHCKPACTRYWDRKSYLSNLILDMVLLVGRVLSLFYR